jgi:hypothetical protein
MKFISFQSVLNTLKERSYWSFCAAIATDEPVRVAPNLRLF